MRSLALAALLAAVPATATPDAAARVREDAARPRPLVAHVVVALCDNDHQGIVPVPRVLAPPERGPTGT
jgi:Asp-tRNA(Asn)/Glu-tRNA(Gln) amidotransferase C subunit